MNRRALAGAALIFIGLAAAFWLMGETERRFPAFKISGDLLADVPDGRAALFIGPVLVIIIGHLLVGWALARVIRHGLWKPH